MQPLYPPLPRPTIPENVRKSSTKPRRSIFFVALTALSFFVANLTKYTHPSLSNACVLISAGSFIGLLFNLIRKPPFCCASAPNQPYSSFSGPGFSNTNKDSILGIATNLSNPRREELTRRTFSVPPSGSSSIHEVPQSRSSSVHEVPQSRTGHSDSIRGVTTNPFNDQRRESTRI